MDCMVVTQVDERKQLLQRAGRCFSCLRRGHLSRNCRATNCCQQCHRKHHTSICSGSTDRWEPTSGAAAVPPPATESTTSNLKPTAPEFTPTEHSSRASTLCMNIGKPILLQTASAVIFNPCDSTSSKLRIVMDSGVSVPTRPNVPETRFTSRPLQDKSWPLQPLDLDERIHDYVK